MADHRLLKLLSREFTTRANIFVNIAANAIVAVAYIVAIPLYLPYIGVEAYGLVGLFAALQTILTVLDLGLSVTLNRELAVRSNSPDRAGEMRDLVRTTEIIYWGIGLLIAISGAASAQFLTGMANPAELSAATIRDCFVIMSIALALQFPIALYSGGLFGLQRQALVSAVFVVFLLLRSLGAVAILAFVSATPQAFFIWQAVCAGLHAATLAGALRLALPPGDAGQFRADIVRSLWRFSAGIGTILVISTIVTQVDKIILIRILSLENFGFYSIAAFLSASVQRLIQPVYQAYFPKLSQLAENSDEAQLARVYHQGSQVMAVIVLPVCASFAFFSWEIMLVWQRDAATARNTYQLVTLLMAGSALYGILFLPYGLQLANGWTKLQVASLIASALLFIPLAILLAARFGGVGTAIVWILYNLVFLAVTVPVMHRRLLKTEKWDWYLNDVLKPLLAVAAAGAFCRVAFIESQSYLILSLELAAAYLIILVAAVMASSHARGWLVARLRYRGA